MPLLQRKERRVSDFRAPSSLSVMTSASSLTLLKERMQFRQLMASGAGNKVKQTLQMILVIMLPIFALLGLTAIALTIRLDTASKASKAKSQLSNVLMVSEFLILVLWGTIRQLAYLIGFQVYWGFRTLAPQYVSDVRVFHFDSRAFRYHWSEDPSGSVISLHILLYFYVISWPSPWLFLITHLLCCQGRLKTFSITYTFF